MLFSNNKSGNNLHLDRYKQFETLRLGWNLTAHLFCLMFDAFLTEYKQYLLK